MKKSERGFSLIELMIVVAILGVLASIAVPNYVEYTNTARAAQARTNLSGFYTAQKIFHGEWLIYFGDFRNIGFSIDGDVYYRIGFNAGAGGAGPVVPAGYTGPGVAAGGAATELNTGFWCPGVPDCNELPNICFLNAVQRYTADTFIAGACSNVTDAAGVTAERWWSIDQGKKLRNTMVP